MRYPIDKKNLGGWAISPELLTQASKLIEPGSVILEIGSGAGTTELRKMARVISIEHDPAYMPEPKTADIRLLIPLDPATGWYEREKVKDSLKGLHYDLIIVDGPSRTGRVGFLHNLDLFDQSVGIIIDDIHRQEVHAMCIMVARQVERKYLQYRTSEKRWFGVIPPTKTH